MPRYYISGIIQIEVRAKNAESAVQKALARQDQLMKSPSLNISVDNISDAESHTTTSFDDAALIDEERKERRKLGYAKRRAAVDAIAESL